MTRANYLLFNPVKHGYVEKLHDYPFSSFPGVYETMAREQLAKQFRDYPGYKDLVLEENDDNYWRTMSWKRQSHCNCPECRNVILARGEAGHGRNRRS